MRCNISVFSIQPEIVSVQGENAKVNVYKNVPIRLYRPVPINFQSITSEGNIGSRFSDYRLAHFGTPVKRILHMMRGSKGNFYRVSILSPRFFFLHRKIKPEILHKVCTKTRYLLEQITLIHVII